MSKTIQIVLKCLAVVFALGMLGAYVWTRQRAAAPEAAANWAIDTETGFPVTPATPTLFDTSKSGKLRVDPVLFSTSKAGPVNLSVTLVPEEKEDSPSPVFISGSKSFNMPVFDTSDFVRVRNLEWPRLDDMKRWQNKINELIQTAESDAQKSGK